MKLLCRLLIVLTASCSSASAGESLQVLKGELDGQPAGEMMHSYLLGLAEIGFGQWKADYEERKTPAQIADYQQRLRKFFIEQIGGLPSERTPLRGRITGTVARSGYTVEKVIFESQPQHDVTAAFFVPDSNRYAPPYPGVLVVCGHSLNGKANDGYQTACALLALNGIAALIVDPISQGERIQLLESDGTPTIGRPTTEHTLIGLGCIPLGRNTARFEIWDGMRGIDYLQSREIIDPQRIGCMGNSGGGTQTAYLTALDDRIVAASPSCYITSFERLLDTIGPQDAEQNIYAQLRLNGELSRRRSAGSARGEGANAAAAGGSRRSGEFGMDHADYLMMRAPTPTLICAATHDFFDITGTWDSFRRAKRLYSRLGHAERIDLIENDDRHGYNQPLRVASARWMLRWLAGRDEAVNEPEIRVLSEREIRCTPQGQVMLMDGARSVFDLNLQENERLARRRRMLWSQTPHNEMLERVRRVAGIRRLNDLPPPTVEERGQLVRDNMRFQKVIIGTDPGISLPALFCTPLQRHADQNTRLTIYLDESGKSEACRAGGPVDRLLADGQSVLAVDLRGAGETQPTKGTWYTDRFGVDGRDVMTAYLLGRSYTGMRAEDVLACARWAAESTGGANGTVDLVATGKMCTPALHAAALEPQLFGSVRLDRPLISWSNLVETPVNTNQLVGLVHGALKVYDLPNLAETFGDRLAITNPLDASGQPVARIE